MAKILIMLAIVFALAIIMPIATIWSLNTLFPALAIPLTFDTWVAAIVLGGVVGGSTGLKFGGNK
jgi:hypothetical protein